MKFNARGLLFDNDGVLVDSHHAAAVAWAKWAERYAPGWDWDSPENAGVRAEDKVRAMVAPELFAEANDYINQLEQDSAAETEALPGAVALTTSLKPGVWTVCTSANANLGRARLEAAGIPVPAELVTGDDVKRGKPDPDPAPAALAAIKHSVGVTTMLSMWLSPAPLVIGSIRNRVVVWPSGTTYVPEWLVGSWPSFMSRTVV